MRFHPTTLSGAWIIEVQPHGDERGFFARTWCKQEFMRHGLSLGVVQCSISFNKQRGTLRGMHYQAPPFEEVKVVRCTKGAVYDVIIDLRAGSESYGQHTCAELTEQNHRAIYVPAGFAHGFQALVDKTEVFYQMSEYFRPEAARGVRWNDPAFGIEWPIEEPILHQRDATYPDFSLNESR